VAQKSVIDVKIDFQSFDIKKQATVSTLKKNPKDICNDSDPNRLSLS
jgi:hypothetical protein